MTRVCLTATCMLVLLTTAAAGQRSRSREPSGYEDGPTSRYELTGWAGYMFGTGMDGVYNGTSATIHAVGGVPFGAAAAFRLTPSTLGELSWTMLPSSLEIRHRLGQPDTAVFDMAVHYVHFASMKEVRSGPMRPFGMGSVGITIFDPATNAFSSQVRFSLGAGAGFKAYMGAAQRLGFRGQGRVFLTFVGSSGGGIVCGGGGCAGSWSGDALFQADFTAGLFLAF